jgi:hypothetical protein
MIILLITVLGLLDADRWMEGCAEADTHLRTCCCKHTKEKNIAILALLF